MKKGKTVSYKEAINDVISLLTKEMNEYKINADKCWNGGNTFGSNMDYASATALKNMIDEIEKLKSV